MTAPDEDDQFHLSGAWNFRDVGGLRTDSGASVRSGVLFRSSQLAGLDDAGLAALRGLGVTDVFDLRSAGEIERAGTDRLPPHVRLHSTPFFPPRSDTEAAPHESRPENPEQARRYMAEEYAKFVSLDGTRTAIVETVRALTESDGVALVHCAAGKDRTGWLIATILLAAGVSGADVEADYLRSNGGIDPLRAMLTERFGELTGPTDDLLGVRSEYLGFGMAAVREQFGSFEAYVGALGLTSDVLHRLRARLLG